ncbi:MAG TPA: histidine phosphatase family protein [Candidatus Dormibacteraeota bacterium]|nr:histidine phosphatase family protein [Candidatus Dormibacteraeota bacterium]
MSQHEVVIVRHGETEWSREGRHTGRTDVPLTDRGRHEAEQLRGLLSKRSFSAVFTSPLRRALDTATLAGFGERLVVDPELQEWDYGEYEGRTSAEIRAAHPGWRLWHDGCPGGETLEQLAHRAESVIARLRAVDGDALVFAHGHVLRVITVRWLELAPVQAQHFALGPASPSTLGYEHDWPALQTWNLPLPA